MKELRVEEHAKEHGVTWVAKWCTEARGEIA